MTTPSGQCSHRRARDSKDRSPSTFYSVLIPMTSRSPQTQGCCVSISFLSSPWCLILVLLGCQLAHFPPRNSSVTSMPHRHPQPSSLLTDPIIQHAHCITHDSSQNLGFSPTSPLSAHTGDISVHTGVSHGLSVHQGYLGVISVPPCLSTTPTYTNVSPHMVILLSISLTNVSSLLDPPPSIPSVWSPSFIIGVLKFPPKWSLCSLVYLCTVARVICSKCK